MELEYIVADFKDKDEAGIYFGFEGKEPLRLIWPCRDEKSISKFENNGYEIRGSVKKENKDRFYMMEKNIKNRGVYAEAT